MAKEKVRGTDIVYVGKDLKKILEREETYGFKKVVLVGKEEKEEIAKDVLKWKKEGLFNRLEIHYAKIVKGKTKIEQNVIPFWIIDKNTDIRKIIKIKMPGMIYGFEKLDEREHLHYSKGGINESIAKMLRENKKIVVAPLDMLREKPILALKRIKQNILLSRKYDFRYVFGSLAKNVYEMISRTDLESFLRMLGSNPKKHLEWLDYLKEE